MAGPMHQPSFPCGAQLSRVAGSSHVSALVPGGARGVSLKSKSPNESAWADFRGFILDVRSKFSVKVACSSNLCHWEMGKCGSALHSPVIKWFLNVRMARSAALTL